MIGEGGQIPWEVARKVDQFFRNFRFVFVLSTKGGIGPDVFISSDVHIDHRGFLQLASWDPSQGAYNFYQRIQSSWVYSGNSFDAHDPKCHGKGPFSGHTTGGLIMKELRKPWLHWHSSEAGIFDSVFPPSHPLPSSALFNDIGVADDLEMIIKQANVVWNKSKVGRHISQGAAHNLPTLFQQVLVTCNTNLISSQDASRDITPESSVLLPATFFLNHLTFRFTGVYPMVHPVAVRGEHYLNSLDTFEVHLHSRNYTAPGDTHFAFVVPEFANEDTNLVSRLIRSQVLSKRLAACLLMVDFSNPIYSDRREHLLQYVPDSVAIGNKGEALDKAFIAAVKASGQDTESGSVEHEFLSYWDIGNSGWETAFADIINGYLGRLQTRCETQEGVNDMIRLAASRREQFRRTPQSEFNLTLPRTNISSKERVKLTQAGTVVPV